MSYRESPLENVSQTSIQPWPEAGLEVVNCCPVCGATSRSTLIEDAYDNVFFCSPGKWTVHRCECCRSGYVSPRPTKDTIGNAYERYYTHSVSTQRTLVQKLIKSFANGYRNYRYKTTDTPATILGLFVAWILPGQRAHADARMRHIPSAPYKGAKLLDVGCGGGEFLAQISSTDWDIMGQDVDSVGVELARSRGFNVVLGPLESLQQEKYQAQFEGITLSHVLEHVHEPLELLLQCQKLLKPGGWLWIETPNLDSQGFEKFGMSWIGFDAPRHLTHFTYDSLSELLVKAGFKNVVDLPYRPLCANFCSLSEQIALGNGANPVKSIRGRLSAWYRFRSAERVAKRNPKKREFCSFKAFAPG